MYLVGEVQLVEGVLDFGNPSTEETKVNAIDDVPVLGD
jgi:hypothetical protein